MRSEADRPLDLRDVTPNGVGVRRRRAPAEAREEILQAANAFLGVHRFRAMTVDAVMKRTQLTRPSFYVHFSGRHDVVAHLARETVEELRTIASTPCGAAGASMDRVDAFPHAFVGTCCGKKHLIRALADAACTCEDIERVREGVVLDLAACVARGMRTGDANDGLDWRHPESAALALVSMLEGYLLPAIETGDASVALETTRMLWRRVVTGA